MSLRQSQERERRIFAIANVSMPSIYSEYLRGLLISVAKTRLESQKFVVGQTRLLNDRVQGSLGQVSWMIRDRRSATADGMAPDFMASFGLTIKDKPRSSQFTDYFCGFQELSWSRNRNFPMGFEGRDRRPYWREFLSISQARLNDFTGDILGDFYGFGDCPPLSDESLKNVAGRQIAPFFQSFYGNRDQMFAILVHGISVT